jgi:hypothetical protein
MSLLYNWMKINAPVVECVWKSAHMKFLKRMLLMLSLKIVMRAWNAGLAALIAPLALFPCKPASAALTQ